MTWRLAHRADPEAKALADRHYNRQNPDSPHFVPPGRCLVLAQPGAFWVTSWPFADYTRHAWAGAWVCSAYRRESGEEEASAQIRAALAVTRWRWPAVPSVRAWRVRRERERSHVEPISICMVTFVDTRKTHRKRDPGRCFRRAGFVDVGETRGGLVALGLPVDALPLPVAPVGSQTELFA